MTEGDLPSIIALLRPEPSAALDPRPTRDVPVTLLDMESIDPDGEVLSLKALPSRRDCKPSRGSVLSDIRRSAEECTEAEEELL
jgi:hypothetical protein